MSDHLPVQAAVTVIAIGTDSPARPAESLTMPVTSLPELSTSLTMLTLSPTRPVPSHTELATSLARWLEHGDFGKPVPRRTNYLQGLGELNTIWEQRPDPFLRQARQILQDSNKYMNASRVTNGMMSARDSLQQSLADLGSPPADLTRAECQLNAHMLHCTRWRFFVLNFRIEEKRLLDSLPDVDWAVPVVQGLKCAGPKGPHLAILLAHDKIQKCQLEFNAVRYRLFSEPRTSMSSRMEYNQRAGLLVRQHQEFETEFGQKWPDFVQDNHQFLKTYARSGGSLDKSEPKRSDLEAAERRESTGIFQFGVPVELNRPGKCSLKF